MELIISIMGIIICILVGIIVATTFCTFDNKTKKYSILKKSFIILIGTVCWGSVIIFWYLNH